jgi:hypothetical protein
MAAMLSRLGGRGYQVQEERVAYGNTESDFDPDSDSDFDLDGDNKEPQQIAPPYPVRPRDARPHWSGEHDVRLKDMKNIIATLLMLTLTGCAMRTYRIPSFSADVVRPHSIPVTNAYVHMSFREYSNINAWFVGPSTKTYKRYDFHTQTDEQGSFRFPAQSIRYLSPILLGKEHHMSRPQVRVICDPFSDVYIVNSQPTNFVFKSVGAQPYMGLIPTNSVFVGKQTK